MRRLGVTAVLCFLLAAGAARGAGFTLGVAAGEVRATSAILWARAPAGRVTVEVSRRRVGDYVRRRTSVTRTGDGTVRATVTGLLPATRYFYRFRAAGKLSATGRFETAAPAGSTEPVRFAYSGDADATPGPDGAPAFNRFGVYAAMARERNDFNVNLGDTIYSDSEVGGSPPARTVAEKWSKYRLRVALPAPRSLPAGTGPFSHLGDHQVVHEFSP